MRVVRTVLGILLLTVAVLTSLVGGALWVATGHESPGGTFGAAATGLSSPGYAIVVTDVDAFLRSTAPFARAARTSVTVDGMTPAGPAFIGLAPLAALRTYLGPAAYGTVTGMHLGLGGPVPVTVSTSAGETTSVGEATPGAGPDGMPGAQRFWVASGTGSLTWAPADRTGLALVIMRADAGAGVTVTGHIAVRPGWLGRTALALFAVALVAALSAIALLLWPPRRREIVYVVEPAQLPEIAEHLGVTGSFPVVQGSARSMPPEPPVAAARASMGDPLNAAIDEADLLPAMLADSWPGPPHAGVWSEPPHRAPSTAGDSAAPVTDASPPADVAPSPTAIVADVPVSRPPTLADFALTPLTVVADFPASRPSTLADVVPSFAAGGPVAPPSRPSTLGDIASSRLTAPGDGWDPAGRSDRRTHNARFVDPADAHHARRHDALTRPDTPTEHADPATGPSDMSVASAHADIPVASAHADIPVASAHADIPVASAHADIPVASADHPSKSDVAVPTQSSGRRGVTRLRRLRVVESVGDAASGTAPHTAPDDTSATGSTARFDNPWIAPSSRARGPRHAAPEPVSTAPATDIVAAEPVEHALGDVARCAAPPAQGTPPGQGAASAQVTASTQPAMPTHATGPTGGSRTGVPPVTVAYTE